MKSLYELIKREHDIVEGIRKYEHEIYCCKRDIEWCNDYEPDCNEKAESIELFEIRINNAELAITNSKYELEIVRRDIRRYFEELNE